jgi:hypothetical protein
MSSALVTPGQNPTHFTTVSSLRKWSLKSVLLRCGCPLYPRKRKWRLLHGLTTKSKQPPATITN